jgi:hypothetical protein
MKTLTYSIVAFFFVMARVGFAQPVVRIPTDIFLEVISIHPDIRAHAEQLGLTTDFGTKGKRRMRYAEAQHKLAAAEHLFFVNKFCKNALLLYQQCWMLEQQMIENDEYRRDILSIRIIESRLLAKQELLLLECDREKRDLELKHADAVNVLNELTRHVFGEQPILPENCVQGFDLEEQAQHNSVQHNIMLESMVDLTEKIVEQERVIVRSPGTEALELMKEFYQIHLYKKERWQVRKVSLYKSQNCWCGKDFSLSIRH